MCDRRFVTDTGFDSHLTKHNSPTEHGPAAELRPDPGSQDRDVNRGPGLGRRQSRDEADAQGEELPLPAGAETLQGSPGVANLDKSSADQLIKDKQDVRQIIGVFQGLDQNFRQKSLFYFANRDHSFLIERACQLYGAKIT